MTLRLPCVHGRYEAHKVFADLPSNDFGCPGGRVATIEDLKEALEAEGWKFADQGERCPNGWGCKRSCLCHRLDPEDLAADLANHYRVKTLSTRILIPALDQEKE